MSRALLSVAIAAVTGGAAVTACFVHTRSNELECTSTSQCTAPRVCLQNYCVMPGGGPQNCPPECSSCNGLAGAMPTCNYSGTGGTAFTCPQGYQCNIDCNGNHACGSVTCTGSSNCTITCEGPGACGSITCGTGSCTVSCTAPGACGSITCGQACACDVTCSGNECGAETCPISMGSACTDGSNNCSSSNGNCNTCP